MTDIKPNVFPKKVTAVSTETQNKEAFEAEKAQATNQVYSTAKAPDNKPNVEYNYLSQNNSIEMMRNRTAEQLNIKNQDGIVKHPELAENVPTKTIQNSMDDKTKDQMKLRDDQLKNNLNQINNYQKLSAEATIRHKQPQEQNVNNNQQPPSNVPPTINGQNMGQNPSNINPYILELSQPNYNAPFDVLPLPSQGKLFRNKKANIRVGYLTTADENILTSPNLLESGEFLEILINRKILEPELRYKDLTVGDRNAIMIWLRATSYGEMYPVTLLDEKGEPFETELNLNNLKIKNLGAEPDAEGLFDFFLPLMKAQVKFKLLTCGDIENIERMVEVDKTNGNPVNNSNTYTMEHTLIEVNGSRDREMIKSFASSIRIGDSKKFAEYIDSVASGVVLDIEVGTPGGGSVKTFLPLNINFFWPDIKI